MSLLRHILAKHYNFKNGTSLTAGVLYLPNASPDVILNDRIEALNDVAFMAALPDGEKAVLQGDGGEKQLRERINQLEVFVRKCASGQIQYYGEAGGDSWDGIIDIPLAEYWVGEEAAALLRDNPPPPADTKG